MKLWFICVLVALCAVSFADSDAIGLIAGTRENLSIALYNSSGELDNGGACSISIYSQTSNLVNSIPMLNEGTGIYSYVWDISVNPGNYKVLFNCTNALKENYSAGGALYVSPRSFEKSVAVGVVKYTQQAEDQYGPAKAPELYDWNLVVSVILALVIFGLILWVLFGNKAKGI